MLTSLKRETLLLYQLLNVPVILFVLLLVLSHLRHVAANAPLLRHGFVSSRNRVTAPLKLSE